MSNRGRESSNPSHSKHQDQNRGHHGEGQYQGSAERNILGQPSSHVPMADDNYSSDGHAYVNAGYLDPHGNQRASGLQETQTQLQEQRQRSLQASKQMLFDVYENLIGQLKELEGRQLGKSAQMKKDHDIRGLVETQLLMFETQMKSCPVSVREEAKQQLIDRTNGWMAHRRNQNLPHSDVDKFFEQLIEILEKGATKHLDDFHIRQQGQRGSDHQNRGHHREGQYQGSPERPESHGSMDVDSYSHYGHAYGNAEDLDPHGNPRAAGPQVIQAQVQEQRQRSLQASKQMLFGVYENLIGQLEELEGRLEKSTQMSKSHIYMPDQSWKKDHDIRRLVEAQLLMFETQVKNCPVSVREEAKQQLIDTTKGWMAHRQDQNLPHSDVDMFAGQLIEILKKGTTKHPADFYHMPDMTREQLQPAVEAIMHGNTKKAALDQEFRDNPDKTASLGGIRSGQRPSEGAERIVETNPDLGEHMEEETENIR